MHWTGTDYETEDQFPMVVDALFGPEMDRL
jgi:hypothetical protein